MELILVYSSFNKSYNHKKRGVIVDIKQIDLELGIGVKVGSTINDGRVNWKINNIGEDQYFNGDKYNILSVVALNHSNQETSIKTKLFWFRDIRFSFQSLDEFESFNPMCS